MLMSSSIFPRCSIEFVVFDHKPCIYLHSYLYISVYNIILSHRFGKLCVIVFIAMLFSDAKPLSHMDSAPEMLKDKSPIVLLVVHTTGVYKSHRVSWAATKFGCDMVLWSERSYIDGVHKGVSMSNHVCGFFFCFFLFFVCILLYRYAFVVYIATVLFFMSAYNFGAMSKPYTYLFVVLFCVFHFCV